MSLEKIKDFVRRTVFFFYVMIFRKEPGPIARKFMRNLGFVFIALVIAKIFSLIFQIYIGRTIGVLEYGKFALITSISSFFWVPMFMGLGGTLVKYLAEQKDEEGKKAVISTGVTLILIFTVISSVIFYIFSSQIASISSVNPLYILTAIILTLCYSAWVLSQRICQGLDRIKKLGSLNVILYSVTLISTFILLIFYMKNVRAPIIGLCMGYIIASVFIFPETRRYFRFRIDRKWAKILLTFSLIAVIGSICFTINENLNKIFINVFLTFKEVGLYQAYYFSTLTVVIFFVTGFVMVFFPEVSRYKNKVVIFNQISGIFRFTPFLYTLLFISSGIILLLYGSEYILSIPLLLLFVFAAVIYSMYSLYMWLSTSIGISGMKITTYSLAVISVLNIVLAYNLIPLFKLYGAVLSIIISYIFGFIFIRKKLSNYFFEEYSPVAQSLSKTKK